MSCTTTSLAQVGCLLLNLLKAYGLRMEHEAVFDQGPYYQEDWYTEGYGKDPSVPWIRLCLCTPCIQLVCGDFASNDPVTQRYFLELHFCIDTVDEFVYFTLAEGTARWIREEDFAREEHLELIGSLGRFPFKDQSFLNTGELVSLVKNFIAHHKKRAEPSS